MSSSISDAVRVVLSGMQFLALPLKEDLINLSALARYIQPRVSQEVGFEANVDSILMTLKKISVESSSSVAYPSFFEVLADSKLFLRTGLSTLYFERSSELYKKLVSFQENVDWAAGEKMYVLQRSEELSVIVMSKYADEVVSFAPSQLLERRDNLALLTVYYPPKGLDVFGLLEFLASQFTALGVSIVECFSSFSKVSFIFDERNASEVYEKLSNAIAATRRD